MSTEQNASESTITPTSGSSIESNTAGLPPGERTQAEAHAESAKVSTMQLILDLVSPENKPAAGKLLLHLMEEARAQGAPPARRRAETPFSRTSFKAKADAAPAATPIAEASGKVVEERKSAFRSSERTPNSSNSVSRRRGHTL